MPVTAAAVSGETRSLYLSAGRAGVDWLLDPDSDVVAGLCHAAETRTKASACHAASLVADLPDLSVLLTQRHFGIANGIVDGAAMDEVLERWRQRLDSEAPRTWGDALGTSVDELRWLLGDNHLRAAGEDRDLLDATDPRGREARIERDNGPVLSEEVLDGVLCLRIRQCGGSSHSDDERLAAWQRDHERHFAHDRILVDLRGNPGGSDGYTLEWISGHVRHPVEYPASRVWELGAEPLGAWNTAVWRESMRVGQALSRRLDRSRMRVDDSVELEEKRESPVIPAATEPWLGRMIALTDRGTASAAESTAWMLRSGFDARIVGGRSGGFMALGNITPYLLPRSGLLISLPTAWFGWRDVEMVGLPIDLAYDVRTPLADIARDFDRIYTAAGAPPS